MELNWIPYPSPPPRQTIRPLQSTAACATKSSVSPLNAPKTGFTGTVGALMESGYEAAVSSLVMLADGTTSLYFSNGGGIIGAGAHKPVVEAAAKFMQTGAWNIAFMQRTTEFPLPRPKHTRFFILSTDGTWTEEAPEQELGQNCHQLSVLYMAGHAVITAIRQHAVPPQNR